jgi:hypothetical protein
VKEVKVVKVGTEGRKEGMKDGRKEGRKEGRGEGRKEGRKDLFILGSSVVVAVCM